MKLFLLYDELIQW